MINMNLDVVKSITLIVLSLIVGCSTTPESPASTSRKISKLAQSVDKGAVKPLLHQYNKWKGTPYSFGGSNKKGVDCSAFVQLVFLEAQQRALPRTTRAQSKLGEEIAIENIKSGDLVFFKTAYKQRHVGIYLDDKLFMHASTSKGVTISRLDNPYWASVFWQARRID